MRFDHVNRSFLLRSGLAFVALLMVAFLPLLVKTVFGYSSLSGPASFDVRVFRMIGLLGVFAVFFSDRIFSALRDLAASEGIKANIVFPFLFLVIIFLVPEIGLRAAGVVQPQGERTSFFHEFYNPSESQGMYTDHQYLEVVPSKNFTGEGPLEGVSTNRHGFRDDELRDGDGIYTIVALGGSTTWGAGVSNNSMTYPSQLEKILNRRYRDRTFEVINAGVPGYTTAESLINFQFRALEYDPDMIIVYNAYNDLKVNHVEGCRNGDYDCWRRMNGEADDKPVWYYSRFFRFIVNKFGDRETQRYDNITSGGVESYRRNLRSLIGMAEKNNVKVVLSTMDHTVTETNLENRPERLKSVRKFLPQLSYEGIRNGMETYNGVVRNVAESQNVSLVDNERKIPSTFEYHTDHVHFTDRGARLLAENFADEIVNISARN